MKEKNHYLDKILSISNNYLSDNFTEKQTDVFRGQIHYIYGIDNTDEIIQSFSKEYVSFVKTLWQKKENEKENKKQVIGLLGDWIAVIDKSNLYYYILNKGKKYNYDCFKDFHNNFESLEEIIESDYITRKRLYN